MIGRQTAGSRKGAHHRDGGAASQHEKPRDWRDFWPFANRLNGI
jgi:hypothetical protein